MDLNRYLDYYNITMSKFAEDTGIKPDTLNKYRYGLRIPNKENMRIIAEKTEKSVTANDFYEL